MTVIASEKPKIAKTIKLFIGGEFPRTESGRTVPVYISKSNKLYAHICKASRKDLRNAVSSAQAAQAGWAARSAYNRTQILYRMAEMTESKREEFMEVLVRTMGYTRTQANKAVDGAIDAFVYFAGFADKYQQLISAVNPVSGPHHNFTTSEPVGVVGLVCNSKFNLADMVSQICAIIASGNTAVVLMSEEGAATIAPLSEVLATSDLPKGVVNLLTGDHNELYTHLGTHMEIQSLSYQGSDKKFMGELKEMAAGNMKRLVPPMKQMNSLDHITSYVEFKTVWHPIGN